jgi:hypothetical protein
MRCESDVESLFFHDMSMPSRGRMEPSEGEQGHASASKDSEMRSSFFKWSKICSIRRHSQARKSCEALLGALHSLCLNRTSLRISFNYHPDGLTVKCVGLRATVTRRHHSRLEYGRRAQQSLCRAGSGSGRPCSARNTHKVEEGRLELGRYRRIPVVPFCKLYRRSANQCSDNGTGLSLCHCHASGQQEETISPRHPSR